MVKDHREIGEQASINQGSQQSAQQSAQTISQPGPQQSAQQLFDNAFQDLSSTMARTPRFRWT